MNSPRTPTGSPVTPPPPQSQFTPPPQSQFTPPQGFVTPPPQGFVAPPQSQYLPASGQKTPNYRNKKFTINESDLTLLKTHGILITPKMEVERNGSQSKTYLMKNGNTERFVKLVKSNDFLSLENELEFSKSASDAGFGVRVGRGEILSHDNTTFILVLIMEKMEGTMEQYISSIKQNSITMEQKRNILSEIDDLLNKLHNFGICHGDVSFQNIMYSGPLKNPKFKFIDFGTATRKNGNCTINMSSKLKMHNNVRKIKIKNETPKNYPMRVSPQGKIEKALF
jgi:hypothetical protein